MLSELRRYGSSWSGEGTTLSILRVSTLFFVQEMLNSVIGIIETLRGVDMHRNRELNGV